MARFVALLALLIAQSADSRQWLPELGTHAANKMHSFLSAVQLKAHDSPSEQLLLGSKDAKKEGDAEAAAGGSEKAKSLQEQGEDKKETIKHWFTWDFWQLVVYCSLTILVFSELITQILFHLIGIGLLLASTMFLIQNVALLTTAIVFATPHAAGCGHILSLAIVMAAIAMLAFLGAASLKFKKLSKAANHVTDDLAHVFRPLSLLVVVFLIVNAILEETKADWGNLAVLVAMLTLGVAFAMAGIVQDMMSYVFIRVNDYFEEGDFVYHDGLNQVKSIHWCHTVLYNLKTKSPMYVPNSTLAGGINNQSQDSGRVFETDFGVPGNPEKAAAVVKDFWQLIRSLDGKGFTGLDGKEYESQIDTEKSVVYLVGTGGNVHVKLVGKYYFSAPPQWKKEGAAPSNEKRQLEWQAPWNFQVENFILEAMKILAKQA